MKKRKNRSSASGIAAIGERLGLGFVNYHRLNILHGKVEPGYFKSISQRSSAKNEKHEVSNKKPFGNVYNKRK